MKAAVIGIGSNSVRMLLAEIANGQGRRLMRDREGTRLFAGLDAQGRLSGESMTQTAAAVRRMALSAREQGAEEIRLFATSATRDAANQGEFAALLRQETGLELEICTGAQEASLSFLGATDGDYCGVVDIGGGTSEVAVISLGGIVASRSVRVGGDEFDQSIIAYIKRKYNLLVGERTAEQIKIEIGSAYPMDPEMTMEIKGRNLVDGLPKNITIHSEEVREALDESLQKIVDAIKETLERTPPELSADIIDHGIMLTGGGALLRGLNQLVQRETGIDVHVAESPLDCVAIGTGSVLDHLDLLGDVLDDDSSHF